MIHVPMGREVHSSYTPLTMPKALRIVVADGDSEALTLYTSLLPALGHTIAASVSNGNELVQHCRKLHPDLVITDINMSGKDGLQAAEEISKERPTPVIVVSGCRGPEFLQRAGAEWIITYLMKPVTEADLDPAITVALYRFGDIQNLRQALNDRKMIGRAKSIIMKMTGIDEEG